MIRYNIIGISTVSENPRNNLKRFIVTSVELSNYRTLVSHDDSPIPPSPLLPSPPTPPPPPTPTPNLSSRAILTQACPPVAHGYHLFIKPVITLYSPRLHFDSIELQWSLLTSPARSLGKIRAGINLNKN